MVHLVGALFARRGLGASRCFHAKSDRPTGMPGKVWQRNHHAVSCRFEPAGKVREPEFNCVPVVLSIADIDLLEAAVKGKELPTTSGFFFGYSDGSEIEDDLLFIRKARQALAEGLTLYYTSWW
jgi:hypothetical protein